MCTAHSMMHIFFWPSMVSVLKTLYTTSYLDLVHLYNTTGGAFPHTHIRKPFLIYDFATAPLWISLYIRKILFSFLSVRFILLIHLLYTSQNKGHNLMIKFLFTYQKAWLAYTLPPVVQAQRPLYEYNDSRIYNA